MKKKIIIWITIITAIVAAIVTLSILSQAKAERDYELENFKIRMYWFGGSKYRSTFESAEEIWEERHDKGDNGIDDPIIIKGIQLWEKEGIVGWASIDKAELDKVMDKIKNCGKYSDQVISNSEKLMYGGYDIFATDMLRFLEAVRAINNEGFSVRDNWGTYLLRESQ